jgi:hypothetical protein
MMWAPNPGSGSQSSYSHQGTASDIEQEDGTNREQLAGRRQEIDSYFQWDPRCWPE